MTKEPSTEREYKILANRLDSWKDELKTNKHGMQEKAERIIKLLEAEIKEFRLDKPINLG